MANPAHSKDPRKQGKSKRTARGLASPGGGGTPPQEPHQAAGGRASDQSRPPPERMAERTADLPTQRAMERLKPR
jgi:hypothetical protein